MSTTSEMPELPSVPCTCLDKEDRADVGCACGDSERVLRFITGQAHDIIFTDAQREWCLSEIASVEGYRREDYAGEPTDNLARAVLEAWTDYCRDKGLI
jgi:hypothetical protein